MKPEVGKFYKIDYQPIPVRPFISSKEREEFMDGAFQGVAKCIRLNKDGDLHEFRTAIIHPFEVDNSTFYAIMQDEDILFADEDVKELVGNVTAEYGEGYA